MRLPDLEPSQEPVAQSEPKPADGRPQPPKEPMTKAQREAYRKELAEWEKKSHRMVDEETGVEYYTIPKAGTTTNANGESVPERVIPGFDPDDMIGEASKFLAHLRVAPSREEIKRLRLERERAVLRKIKDYETINQEAIQKEREMDEQAEM